MNESKNKILHCISEIAQIMSEKKLFLGVAESCTGGLLSNFICALPGASQYFKGSIVAYHNSIKQNILQIDEQEIEYNGVVSKEVVEAMAINARRILRTDWSVAVTGIAGPDGGSSENPVGTCWIAIANSHGCTSFKKIFKEKRNKVQELIVYTIVQELKNQLSTLHK
ncbi:MAG: CinA family protein [Fibrobacter sp.]|nr:CinA family protein [Fibrobacter sp.]